MRNARVYFNIRKDNPIKSGKSQHSAAKMWSVVIANVLMCPQVFYSFNQLISSTTDILCWLVCDVSCKIIIYYKQFIKAPYMHTQLHVCVHKSQMAFMVLCQTQRKFQKEQHLKPLIINHLSWSTQLLFFQWWILQRVWPIKIDITELKPELLRLNVVMMHWFTFTVDPNVIRLCAN